MKQLLLTLILAAGAQMSWADTYPYLSFEQTDGTMLSLNADALTMTFDGDKLVANDGQTTTTLSVAQLSRMFFSAENTAIVDINADAADAQAEVYSAAGVFVGKFANAAEARTKMKGGVYVIKQNGKTFKMIAR